MASHANDDNTVESCVSLSITAAVEPMAVGFAAGRWDWTGATHLGESCFRLDALGIAADQQQHLSGGAGGDAMRLNQLRGTSSGKRFEVGVVFLDLGIQHKPASGDCAQRNLG